METIVLIVGGLVVTLLAQLAKKYNIKVEYVIILTSLVLGSGYYFLQNFLPQGVWEQVTQAVLAVAGTSALIYNHLIKRIGN